MSAAQRRVVSFAGSAVVIEYDGAQAAAVIDFLYRHVPATGDVAPHAVYRLTSGERWSLDRDGTLLYQGVLRAVLAQTLLGDTCHCLAERSQGGLLFHAAALTWQGQGLLLPGGIGAGKTTLAAWLTARGLDYLTDELVFVPWGAETLQAFTRPLNLKRPARPALRDQFDVEAHAAHVLSSPRADLIPPASLKPDNVLSEPPWRVVLFPRYQPGADFHLRPLSKAQAGMALMACLVNARNLPGHGFAEVARLARLAPAYALRYAHLDQIAGWIDDLMRSLENSAQSRREAETRRKG